MDEERQKAWLHKVSTESRYRAVRRANHAPKNLQSTGHPHLINAADPNPSVISNSPKKRFSKEQRDYLKSAYWHYVVGGKLLRQEARQAFNVRSIYQEDSKLEPGDKVQDVKSAYRSSKRSAKNLAEYGYVILSYDAPRDTFDMEFNPNRYQPVLYITPTMAAVEKGREFREQDGEHTDPDEIKRRHEEVTKAWLEALTGFKNS